MQRNMQLFFGLTMSMLSCTIVFSMQAPQSLSELSRSSSLSSPEYSLGSPTGIPSDSLVEGLQSPRAREQSLSLVRGSLRSTQAMPEAGVAPSIALPVSPRKLINSFSSLDDQKITADALAKVKRSSVSKNVDGDLLYYGLSAQLEIASKIFQLLYTESYFRREKDLLDQASVIIKNFKESNCQLIQQLIQRTDDAVAHGGSLLDQSKWRLAVGLVSIAKINTCFEKSLPSIEEEGKESSAS